MDSLTQNELCLYEILHHPVLFMEFITPVNERATTVLPFRDWLHSDNWGRVRLYQLPTLGWDHLLPDDVPIDSGGKSVDRKAIGTCYDWGGRNTSKSWGLIHDVLQDGIVRPGEEDLVTSRDANHLAKRMDSIWRYTQEHPLIRALITSKKKSDPFATIEWWNAHKTIGVYESIAGKGDNYLGTHSHRVNIDEFQLTSDTAYKKLYDAKAEDGCVYRTTGVSDGRMDTPAHAIRNDPEEASHVHQKAQFLNEIVWTATNKKKAIESYGGEEAQDYKTNVKAEEGDPTTGTWNMAHVQLCLVKLAQDRRKPLDYQRPVICPVVRIPGSQITKHFKFENIQFPRIRASLNDSISVWLSMDVGGRSDPTVIGVWGVDKDRIPHLWGLVILMQFDDYDDQVKVVEEMISFYGVSYVGVDTGEGGGQHITVKLRANKGISASIIGVVFSSNVVIPDLTGLEPEAQRRNVETPTRNLSIKCYTTNQLQIRLQQQRIKLLHDAEFMTQLLTEVTKQSSGRMRTIPETYHPGAQGDHTIAMLRVLEYMFYVVDNISVAKKSNVANLMQQGFVDLGVL